MILSMNIQKKGLDYLMRVKVSFSKTIIAFEQSKKKSCVVELYSGKNSKLSEKEYSKNCAIKVRLMSEIS